MNRWIIVMMRRILSTDFIILCAMTLLLQGCSNQSTANLQNLTLPKTQNYYLMCPQNYCNVTPNENPPVFPVSADDLFNAWNLMMTQEKYVSVLDSVPSRGQYDYIARSYILDFPDIVTVQFIAVSDTSSTLAVYSRSIYGFYDFGMNKKRLQQWMQQLNISVNDMIAANVTSGADTTTDNSTSSNNTSTTESTTTSDNSAATGNTTTTTTTTITDNSIGTTSTQITPQSTTTSTDNSANTPALQGTNPSGTSTNTANSTNAVESPTIPQTGTTTDTGSST